MSTSKPRRSAGVPSRLDPLDAVITASLARYGITVIRVGLGLIFLWFGGLKFVPGMSPAEDLATRTIEHLTLGTIGPALSLPVLATWECAIGLGLLTKRFLRATLLLLATQMVGTAMPLILFPAETFEHFPLAPTLEGQYIIKNVVLIGAGMVIGSTVRGGGLTTEAPAGAHDVANG